MNELTDQLITLFSSILITVMFLAVAVNIFRRIMRLIPGIR